MTPLKVGDRVYLPSIERKEDGTGVFLILEGEILAVDDDKCHVRFDRNGEVSERWLPKLTVHSSREGAERKVLAAEQWKVRQDMDRAMGCNHAYLVKPLTPVEGIYYTSDPLRFGEPGFAHAAQMNTYGAPANVSKCLQNIAAICNNIRALYAILYTLTFANDYAKKLIGKYIVIEQESVFRNFLRMSKLDPENEQPDFTLLKAEIKQLNDEYGFNILRDKLASHRDADMDFETMVRTWRKLNRYSLQKYNEALQRHLDRVLARHPLERDYFRELGPIQWVTLINDSGWTPFDDPLTLELGENHP